MVQSQDLQEAIDHFRKEPWCAALIDAPGTFAVMPSCRRNKSARDGGRVESQDELFRSALNNDDSIPYMLFLFPEPDNSKSDESKLEMSIMSGTLLMDLREGVKGFNSFAHGGFLGAAMDEAMGGLIFMNYEYQRAQDDEAVKNGGHWTPPPGVLNMNQGVRIMTASMNIRFRRPVSLPTIAATTTTISRIDGRKIFLDVDVRDANAQTKKEAYATCEGMWMAVSPKKKSKM